MQSAFDVIFGRRPPINYICPPVCEVNFSGSGTTSIVLDPLFPNGAVSGLERGGIGGRRLRWNAYPGAICYSIYQADIPGEAFGTYHIIAECLPDNSFELPPGVGPFVVTAITPDGETPPSTPIFGGPGPGILSNVTVEADPSETAFEDDPAIFTFFRTSPFTEALSVNYEIAGTASPGVDYVPLAGTVNFPAGQPSVDVPVTALDSELDDSKNVVVTILEGENYNIEEPSSAVVTINAVSQATIEPIDLNTLYHLSDDGHVSGIRVPGGFAEGYVFFEGVYTPTHIFGGGFQSYFPFACNSLVAAGVMTGSQSDGWYDTTDLGINTVAYALSEDGYALCNTPTGVQIYNPNTTSFTLIGAGGTPAFDDSLNPGLCFADNHNAVYLTTGPGKVWFYSGGVSTDITPPGVLANSGRASKVTSSGYVTTWGLIGGKERGFVYFGGVTSGLGLLPGGNSCHPADVNESGLVVGDANNASDIQAFMWTLADGIQAIPTLPGTLWGSANAVNADGWIAGIMNDGTHHGFIYRDGVTEDLLDLIPDTTGWDYIDRIKYMNDAGQIVGRGRYNGVTTFFIINNI